MNPNDIQYLTSEADRGGYLGDVLQVFVHDFTLRQSAGEAKVQEVERKIGGVNSELFILRKLLQDFQTRLDNDRDIIMRLQHEIDGLHKRVRSLDSKHTVVETQSSRLDLRIEQLREQLNQSCEGTQQNVSRLLGNFARIHMVSDRNTRHDCATNTNNTEFKRNYDHSQNLDSMNHDPPKVSLQEESAAYLNRRETEARLRDSASPQHLTYLQEATTTTTITTNTTTTQVLNDEFHVDEDCKSTTDKQVVTHSYSFYDESTPEEEEKMDENVEVGLQETSQSGQTLEAGGSYMSVADVANVRSCKSESTNVVSNNIQMQEDFKADDIALHDASYSTAQEAKIEVATTVNDMYEDILTNGKTVQEALPEVTTTKENLLPDDAIDDEATTNKEVPEVLAAENSTYKDDLKEGIGKEEINTVKEITASCKILPQTSEAAGNSSPQTASKKNKSKRSRGRKRKDSHTESQTNAEDKNRQVPSQDNKEHKEQVTLQNNIEESADDQQECSGSRRKETIDLDEAEKIESIESKSVHSLQNETQSDFVKDEGLTQQTDGTPNCVDEQTGLQYEGEEAAVVVVQEQVPELLHDDQITVNASESTSQQQSDGHTASEECGGESSDSSTKEEQNTLNGNGKPLQCDELQESSDSDLRETWETQRSFSVSTAQAQNEVSAERVSSEVKESSSQTKCRVTFQSEIDDDEIPDLSDMDGLTEEENKRFGIDSDKGVKPNAQRNPGENRIEIKSPTGETTNLEPLQPQKRENRRMESASSDDPKEEVVGMCANCSNIAKLRCGNCRQAFYCKRECQRDHWKTSHKDQCRPYQVLQSAELGRYMVASRDLKAGDLILKEDPIVVGPKQITEPICLGCYKRVDGSYRCRKCHWPLCGPQCEKSPDHQPECIVGMEIGSPIEISNFDEPNHFYEVIFPLRCLTLKKKSPKKYEQLVTLDSHYDDRKGTHVYVENQKSIVNMLRNYFLLQQFPIEDIDSSEKSIHNVTGVIDVNALELRMPESEILGLYPNFAMMEHSCTPNTKHTFNDSRQVVLKAAVDIKSGEHLSTMYTHILWGTLARRDHLKHSKYFMCTCFRCSDPTELGTNFSTLRCKSCPNGFMMSAAPLDELADWLCTSCNETIKSEEVTEINLKLGEEFEKCLAAPTVPILEEQLQKQGKETVHPNHYHLFATRHTLLQMYGRDPTYASEEYMKKKERMCQDFLKVCTALDPGMSRLAPYAGVALYEYHLAVLSRTRQDPNARQTDPVALKKDVETAKALLQQCIRVLQDEPKDQPEGQLCHVAQQNLIELKQWEANLFSP